MPEVSPQPNKSINAGMQKTLLKTKSVQTVITGTDIDAWMSMASIDIEAVKNGNLLVLILF